MLTGKKCFNKYIPDDLKEEFKEMTEKSHTIGGFEGYIGGNYFTVGSFIAKAFVWTESPSGYKIWSILSNHYKKITK